MIRKDRIRTYTIVVSIFLHLLILLFIQIDQKFLFPEKSENVNKIEDRLVFELVETPENMKQELPDAKSDLISDKNTKAADLADSELPKTYSPFQQGNIKFPEFYEPDYEIAKKSNPQHDSPADILKDIKDNKKSFMETFQASMEMQKTKTNDLEYENLITEVKNHGGMSLNTYKWEFAPYLLEMKRKVQAHNNPPFAFTHLGAIDGDILLRFKVYRDGSLKDLEILSSNAHYSLDATSTRAIQFSAPFKQLPGNFPKEYLEITALFSYILGK